MWSDLIGQLEVHIFLLMDHLLGTFFFSCFAVGVCFASNEGSSGDTPSSTTTTLGTVLLPIKAPAETHPFQPLLVLFCLQ